jgi:hypothetical protein
MATKKEPPDKYRCLKLPISSILFDSKKEDKNKETEKEVEQTMDILQKAIVRINTITKNGVNLIKDEGIKDTLLDLHNYAAMALMLLDE